MKKRRIISLAVTAAVVLSVFAGCTANEYDIQLLTEGVVYVTSESRTPLSYEAYVPYGMEEGILPMGGFYGPEPSPAIEGNKLPDIVRQEVYDLIAEAGINIVIHTESGYDVNNPGLGRKRLEMAEKAGLKLALPVGSVINPRTIMSASTEKMVEILGDILEKYPAFLGVFGRDEANKTYFPLITTANDSFKAAAAELDKEDLFIFWNAAGYGSDSIYYSGSAEDYMTYDQYLDLYTGIEPKYISSACYPMYKDTDLHGEVADNYFKGLSAIRAKSQAAGIPYWFHTQNGGDYNDMEYSGDGARALEEGEYIWNMNTVLAYGAKGLILFPMSFPVEWIDTRYDLKTKCLLDPYGNKNAYWYYMKKMSEQIGGVQGVLTRSKHVGIIAHGDSPAEIPKADMLGEGWRELTKVTGDSALIGCFDYNGKTALYVVNNSLTKSDADITLTFDKKYGYDIVQRGKTVSVAATRIPLKLDAGESALIVLR